jgi:hypothetical protein
MNRNSSPSFDTWQHENLVKFAEEAFERLQEQAEQIAQLRIDVIELHVSFRNLLMRMDDGK